MSYIHKDWTEEEIAKLCDLFDSQGGVLVSDEKEVEKDKNDEKEVEKDKKYEVVLSPSFPEEYRAEFEDILEEVNKSEKKA
ncbi:hypothetical protein HOE22_08985 [Candidatus Woesearchaeota archaeon]|jgi:hypothetical protein|nr:hypothetical protein [Candidatus Woesearchaeota archaeon]